MNGYNYDPGFDGSTMTPGGQVVGEDMMMMGQDGMGNGMVGGQSLEDIVNQNAKVIRRQSMPQQYGNTSSNGMDADMRRMSMMEYNGASPAGPMGNFPYNANVPMQQGGMMGAEAMQSHQQRPSSHGRRESNQGDLALNTSFPSNTTQGYNPMMHNSAATFGSPAHPNSGFDMTMDSPYIDHGTGMGMDYNLDQSMATPTPIDSSHMNLYSQPQFNQPVAGSPMPPGPSNSHSGQTPVKEQMGGGSGMNTQYGSLSNASRTPSRHISRSQSLHLPPNMNSPAQSGGGVTPLSQQGRGPKLEPHSSTFTAQPQNPPPGSRQDVGMGNATTGMDGINGPIPIDMSNYDPNRQNYWENPEGGWPSTMIGRSHVQTSYKNAYSSTGFDMLGVLV